MKILLTTNKTYRGFPDTGHWYVYLPLKELGHQVYWYDTVDPKEKDYDKIIEKFKPDLIFCCVTGDGRIAPYEPWGSIKRETDTGRTVTFNWFCDDTWRFDRFSSIACSYFTMCSTPEISYIDKYKNIGYNNILLGNWHANSDFYPVTPFLDKNIDISFIGAPNASREAFFNTITPHVDVTQAFGLTQEELFETHCRSQIGLNLSFNANDPEGKTQMKQRLFEITAGGGLLFTQNHIGLEEFFEIDKEIITFESTEEFVAKAQFFLKNPSLVEKIATNGHKRFLAEHDSKIRLAHTLEKIKELS
jgi:spore maturation protein CgeB